MSKAIWAAGLALALAVGCGGSTIDGGGTGGSGAGAGSGGDGGGVVTGGAPNTGGVGAGGAGGTATGGSGGMPSECTVPVTEPGPYPLKLAFVNPTSQPLFIREDCAMNWSLYSCADGYTTSLSHTADCTMQCAPNDPNMGCMMCGMCMTTAIPVSAGNPAHSEWSGTTYTFGEVNNCPCHNELVAPPGKYAIRVPVYLSEQDAQSNNAAYDAWAYFDLPSKTGTVEVILVALGD